jgi:hypothetical protein
MRTLKKKFSLKILEWDIARRLGPNRMNLSTTSVAFEYSAESLQISLSIEGHGIGRFIKSVSFNGLLLFRCCSSLETHQIIPKNTMFGPNEAFSIKFYLFIEFDLKSFGLQHNQEKLLQRHSSRVAALQ